MHVVLESTPRFIANHDALRRRLEARQDRPHADAAEGRHRRRHPRPAVHERAEGPVWTAC
jgi:hypothetical protein